MRGGGRKPEDSFNKSRSVCTVYLKLVNQLVQRVLMYLCASEGFHFPILNTRSSFTDVHGVVEQGLVLGGELLRPVPDWREIHRLFFTRRDGFTPGKVL